MSRSVFTSLFMTVLLLIISNSSQADNLLVKDILAPFKQVMVFKGGFRQEKKLPILMNPFVSNGEFISVRDRGMVWKTLTPASSTLVMVPGKIIQEVNGRQQSFQATGSGYDGLAILLPALLDGDIKTLQRYFSIGIIGNRQQWTIEMTPVSKELASVVHSVSVKGAAGMLKDVSLSGPGGDLTHISFLSVSMSSEAPDAADLAHFE